MDRNPRIDPRPGDVMHTPDGDSYIRHTVTFVSDSIVKYKDENPIWGPELFDSVPIKKWRDWYLDSPDTQILAIGK